MTSCKYAEPSQEAQPLPATAALPSVHATQERFNNCRLVVNSQKAKIAELEAELSRLTSAINHLLSFCDANPEGETPFEQAVIRAIDAVEGVSVTKEEQGGWIDCKQELPNVGQKVLVWHIKAEAEHIARYQPLMDPVFPWRDSFNGGDGPSVTHWQPLPTPPDSRKD